MFLLAGFLLLVLKKIRAVEGRQIEIVLQGYPLFLLPVKRKEYYGVPKLEVNIYHRIECLL